MNSLITAVCVVTSLLAMSSASSACALWINTAYAYEFCIPPGWRAQTTPAGDLFLCSDLKGKCTSSRGGILETGTGTIAVIRIDTRRLPLCVANLENCASGLIVPRPTTKSSKTNTLKGHYAEITYSEVTEKRRALYAGAAPAVSKWVFASSGSTLFYAWLNYYTDDTQGRKYEAALWDVLLSFRQK